MSFEVDFRAVCLAASGVSSALGGRLYHVKLPQAPAYPCGVFRVISDVGVDDHETSGEGLARRRVQVDLYARVSVEATAARDALRNGLNGFSGVQGSTDFQEVFWASCVSLDEKALDVYRYSVDLMVVSRPV
jgi:hypothetical protein